MNELYYYEVKDLSDDQVIMGAFFKSVTIHTDPKKNVFTEWPPKVGDTAIVFNDILTYFKTKPIQVVRYLDEDTYEVTTFDGVYIFTRKVIPNERP